MALGGCRLRDIPSSNPEFSPFVRDRAAPSHMVVWGVPAQPWSLPFVGGGVPLPIQLRIGQTTIGTGGCSQVGWAVIGVGSDDVRGPNAHSSRWDSLDTVPLPSPRFTVEMGAGTNE